MENNTPSTQTPQAQETGTIDSDKLISVAGKLLANPELISSVASALGLGNPLAAQAEQKEETEHKTPAESDGSVEALSQSLPQKDKLPDIISTLSPLLSTLTSSQSHSDNRRACLLRALKPYLSRERSDAIDYIIKLSEFSEVFKSLSKEAPNV